MCVDSKIPIVAFVSIKPSKLKQVILWFHFNTNVYYSNLNGFRSGSVTFPDTFSQHSNTNNTGCELSVVNGADKYKLLSFDFRYLDKHTTVCIQLDFRISFNSERFGLVLRWSRATCFYSLYVYCILR